MPRVSVIVPVFDLGPYLDEAVTSVLRQTYQDFEILVIDDGSTDPATRALLDRFERPKVGVLRRSHAGLAAARNAGVAEARGEYVCALDADDKLDPTFLEKATRVLDADPDLAFVSCWLRTFGDEEWDWMQRRCDLPALLSECTVATPALVRRAAVVAAGGYDGAMPVQGYEDWDLWITLVEGGYRGLILPEVLFFYRRRKGSMSETCNVGEGHLALYRYLVGKHERSYREHFRSVLSDRDGAIADSLRASDDLDRHLVDEVAPAIARRRAELGLLRERLARLRQERAKAAMAQRLADELGTATVRLSALRQHLESSETALAAARYEADALRASLSWRLTAPLRALYDALRTLAGRRP